MCSPAVFFDFRVQASRDWASLKFILTANVKSYLGQLRGERPQETPGGPRRPQEATGGREEEEEGGGRRGQERGGGRRQEEEEGGGGRRRRKEEEERSTQNYFDGDLRF